MHAIPPHAMLSRHPFSVHHFVFIMTASKISKRTVYYERNSRFLPAFNMFRVYRTYAE